jgi:Asp/Glu/hydantoin racemase
MFKPTVTARRRFTIITARTRFIMVTNGIVNSYILMAGLLSPEDRGTTLLRNGPG